MQAIREQIEAHSLTLEQVQYLVQTSSIYFLQDSTLLQLSSPCVLVGDIRGHYKTLLQILPIIDSYLKQSYRIVFLGGTIGHGENQLTTMMLFAWYKIMYPKQFFILRGCFESTGQARIYGSVLQRFAKNVKYSILSPFFDSMPFAAILDGTAFVTTGGISEMIMTSWDAFFQVKRPVPEQDYGLLHDLTRNSIDDELFCVKYST